jgi:hypothetical protein
MSDVDDAVTLANVTLLRGTLYAQQHPKAWEALLAHTARVRDHQHLNGANVMIDEVEQYAWLRQRDDLPDDTPRLMRRHQLSYGATVMLVCLRQAMLQEETQGAVERFVFITDTIVEMTRQFHPDTVSDDALRGDIGKLADMGYLRRMPNSTGDYEALRIIKAHVTADWIAQNAEALRGRHLDTDRADADIDADSGPPVSADDSGPLGGSVAQLTFTSSPTPTPEPSSSPAPDTAADSPADGAEAVQPLPLHLDPTGQDTHP